MKDVLSSIYQIHKCYRCGVKIFVECEQVEWAPAPSFKSLFSYGWSVIRGDECLCKDCAEDEKAFLLGKPLKNVIDRNPIIIFEGHEYKTNATKEGMNNA